MPTRLPDQLKDRARVLKRDTLALYLAAGDPRTPWYAKLVAAAVVAYALSPLDLIPDFIPVLGYLDDLIIVPLGINAVGICVALRLRPRPRSCCGVACELATAVRRHASNATRSLRRKRGLSLAVSVVVVALLVVELLDN